MVGSEKVYDAVDAPIYAQARVTRHASSAGPGAESPPLLLSPSAVFQFSLPRIFVDGRAHVCPPLLFAYIHSRLLGSCLFG